MTEYKIMRYLQLAQNACEFSNNRRTRVGSVLVYRGKVISVGWNEEDKTSPIQAEYNRLRGYDPNAPKQKNSIHAEMSCMLKLRHMDIDWGKCDLFVCRVLKDGTRAMSRPCPACMGYAVDLGIKNFYYTTGADSWAYEKVSNG